MTRNSATRAAGSHARANSFYVFSNRKCCFVTRAPSSWALHVFTMFFFLWKGRWPGLTLFRSSLRHLRSSKLLVTVSSPWTHRTHALEANLGQIRQHKDAGRRNATQTKYQSASLCLRVHPSSMWGGVSVCILEPLGFFFNISEKWGQCAWRSLLQ